MRTSKPFATISYNSSQFLESKILELINNGIVDFACYCHHEPEEDEKKAHKHLYIIPSAICDTNKIREFLEEKVEDNDIPLKCLPCVSSKFDDWYLYAVHDSAYLASKGQSRKHKYLFADIRSTDEDLLREMVNNIDRSKFIGIERVVNAVKDSKPFDELILQGAVPIQLINQYKYAYECIFSALNRGGRHTHTPKSAAKKCAKLSQMEVVNVDGKDCVVDEDGVVCQVPFE